MPYITPRTNWSSADGVTDADMNRIEGNIAELKKAATIDLAEAVMSSTNVEGALHELGSELVTGKNEIRNSIISMGVSIASSGALSYLAGRIREISKDATAAPSEVIAGKTFYSGGVKRTGTQILRNAGDYVAGSTQPAGTNLRFQVPLSAFYTTDTWITANDPDFIASNIKTGVNIFGVVGTFNSATSATAGDLLDGRTAHSNGNPITGTMPNRSGSEFHIAGGYSINGNNLHFHIPYNGYYSTYNKIWLEEPNWQPNNIRKGTTIFGKTGTLVEGANYSSNITYSATTGSYYPQQDGSFYMLQVRVQLTQYYIARDFYNSSGAFLYTEYLTPIDYPGEGFFWYFKGYRDSFVVYLAPSGDYSSFTTGKILMYSLNGVLLAQYTGFSYASHPQLGRPDYNYHTMTKQGILVVGTGAWLVAWAKNGVVIAATTMATNMSIRNQGPGWASTLRDSSWLQVAEGKLFADVQVSNSSHTNAVVEVTLGLDGLSASFYVSDTWASIDSSKNFLLNAYGFLKKHLL